MVKSATLGEDRGSCLLLSEVPHMSVFSDSVFHIYVGFFSRDGRKRSIYLTVDCDNAQEVLEPC